MNTQIQNVHQTIESLVEQVMASKPAFDSIVGDLQTVHMLLSRYKNVEELPAQFQELVRGLESLRTIVRDLQEATKNARLHSTNWVVKSTSDLR